jgi:hypothetical protein
MPSGLSQRNKRSIRPAAANFQTGRRLRDLTTKRTKITKSEHKPPDALLEQRDVEVHQETETTSGQLHIGQDLSFMDARQRIDGLDFDDYEILDDQVDAISRVELDAVIDDGQRHLPSARQATRMKLMGQTMFIGRFQQPRTKRPMNLQPGVNNGPGEAVQISTNFLVILVFLAVHDAISHVGSLSGHVVSRH